MTTIAYKADTLSFDSQANGEDRISGAVMKGGRMADGSLWAFCGNLWRLDKCKRWVTLPLNDPPDLDVDSELIVIRRDGSVLSWEVGGWIDLEAPFYAWGSGAAIAMGAMYAGASAEQAVKIAADLDPWTGGKIHALTLAEIYAPPDEDLNVPDPDAAAENWPGLFGKAEDPRKALRRNLGLE